MNTLLFVLRWQLIPFVLGLLAVVLSAYGLVVFQGDPPDATYSSLAGMIGQPVLAMFLVTGLLAVFFVFKKAAEKIK